MVSKVGLSIHVAQELRRSLSSPFAPVPMTPMGAWKGQLSSRCAS
jgi:hypothetical protein